MAEKPSDAILGVDIGGTSLKAALVDVGRGELSGEVQTIGTPKPAPPYALSQTFAELVSRFPAEARIGCGFPGIVKDGKALSAVHLSKEWLEQSVTDHFSRALDNRTVYVINDADAAGLAEMQFGAGLSRNHDRGGTVLMVTLGTGIGTALFYGGHLIPNTELGHIYVGEVEAEQMAAGSIKTKLNLSWQDWANRVSQFLQEIEKLVSPDLIIVGGGVSEHFTNYAKFLKSRAELVPAKLGNDAGLVGAALVASQERNY